MDSTLAAVEPIVGRPPRRRSVSSTSYPASALAAYSITTLALHLHGHASLQDVVQRRERLHLRYRAGVELDSQLPLAIE